VDDDLTDAQQDFVVGWFFASPLIVLSLLILSVLLIRRPGERQWLRVFLGLVIGGALPGVVLLTAMVGLFPVPSSWHSTTVLEHLRLAGEEEVLKFVAAVVVCLPFSGRSVVMAGVIGAAVATGFTITENARFFITAPSFGIFEAIIFVRTFVPVHVVLTCAACMVAAAGWASRGRGWWAYGAVAPVGATVLHAGHNLRLDLDASWLDTVVHASFVLAALGLVAVGALHRHRSARAPRPDEPRR